ncbi:hypothetical protein VQ056_05450 [Paenibacillus sp. JTLBN-2024]
MYDITKDRYYLDAATRIFRWGKTMLTDGVAKCSTGSKRKKARSRTPRITIRALTSGLPSACTG